jgi:PD-(D/E)XK nuclease superfamily
MSGEFYRLTGPSAWRTTVDQVSHSSLTALERCPRQWQLLRSEWPDFGSFPQRRHRGTIEGTIVHETLDRIFRAMALRGLPKPGTTTFRAVMAELDVVGGLRREINAWNEEVAAHPRAALLRMQTTERALYNKVAELFQAEYARVDPGIGVACETSSPHGDRDALTLLRNRGVLTEWNVAHPTLPVRGQIDLIRRDAQGTCLVDFKTGTPKPEYRDQLALYALLWWRSTGELPVATELRHPRGCDAFPVERENLVSLESGLATRIANARAALAQTPATARTGEHCGLCDVRPFCDDYWRASPQKRARKTTGPQYADLEVRVPDRVDGHGFVAEDGRRHLSVVWDEEALLGEPFTPGETLRIVGARIEDDDAVRLISTTEVFRRSAQMETTESGS